MGVFVTVKFLSHAYGKTMAAELPGIQMRAAPTAAIRMVYRKNAFRQACRRHFQGADGALGFQSITAVIAGYFPGPLVHHQRQIQAAFIGSDIRDVPHPRTLVRYLIGTVKRHILDQIVKHRQAVPAVRCPGRGGKLFKQRPFLP